MPPRVFTESDFVPTKRVFTEADFSPVAPQQNGGFLDGLANLFNGKGDFRAAAETATGGAIDLLNKAAFNLGDEITAGGASIGDAIFRGQDIGQAYDERLAQARDLAARYAEENPKSSLFNSLVGVGLPVEGLFTKAPGIVNAAKNIATGGVLGGALGAASGFGAGEGAGDRLQNIPGAAESGAMFGAGGAALGEAISGIANKLGKSAKAGEEALVGYSPSKASNPTGYADEAGNILPYEKGVPKAAVEQISPRDVKIKNLRDAGFFERIKATDTPKSVSLKLDQFKSEIGQKIGNIVDEAAATEQEILSNAAPWEAQKLIADTAPEFSEVRSFIEDLKLASRPLAARLGRKLDDIEKGLSDSSLSLKELKNLQETYGKINKKTIAPVGNKADELAAEFDQKVYQALKQSVEKRITALRPDLKEPLLAANKAYSASKEFIKDAFNSSREKVGRKIINDFFGSTGGGLARTGVAFLARNTSAAPIFAAERLATALKDVAPVQSTLAARGGSALLNALAPYAMKAGQSAILGENYATPNVPTSNGISEFPNAEQRKKKDSTPVMEPVSMTDSGMEDLVNAVIQQESGGKINAVSPAGAQGLMQLMPATGRELHKKAGLKGPYDPFDADQNKTLGTLYLQELLSRYRGDKELALAAYNWGMGNVDKALRKAQVKSFGGILHMLPPETAKYVPSVLQKMGKNRVRLVEA